MCGNQFFHKNQSEYYGGNILVSIEGIVLDHFSDPQQPSSLLASGNFSHHDVFYSFFYYDRKQDASTTAAHSKGII